MHSHRNSGMRKWAFPRNRRAKWFSPDGIDIAHAFIHPVCEGPRQVCRSTKNSIQTHTRTLSVRTFRLCWRHIASAIFVSFGMRCAALCLALFTAMNGTQSGVAAPNGIRPNRRRSKLRLHRFGIMSLTCGTFGNVECVCFFSLHSR